MKNISQIISLALLDGNSRKKKTRFLFLLTAIALTLFMVVNSLVGSLINGVNGIVNKPYGRVFSILADVDDYEKEMQEIKEKYSESEEIGQVFWHIYVRPVDWLNSELVGQTPQRVDLVTAVDALEDYILEGKAHPERGEILVPKFLYDMGECNKYTYRDGSKLMGKTLTFRVQNMNTEETKEYSYKVVGVYDNVKCSNKDFCINEMDAMEMDEFYWFYKQEERIRAEMEKYDIPEEEYSMMLQGHVIGFYVSPGYDVEEVRQRVIEDTRKSANLQTMPADDIVAYYGFIVYLGNIIVLILGITAVIVLAVTILRDLRQRRGQIALRYACGYSKGFQIAAYIVEQFMLLCKACLTGVVLTEVVILGGNYIISHIVSFYMRDIRLYLDWGAITAAVCVVFLCGLFCLLVTIPGIRRIHSAETLKKEEGR